MDEKSQSIFEAFPEAKAEPEGAVLLMFTNYARADLVMRRGDLLYGNWSPSFAGACIDPYNNRTIQRGSIQSLNEVGRCDRTGYVIFQAVHY